MVMAKKHKTRENNIKRSKGERVLYSFVWILLILYTISMVYPIIWMGISSFKPFVDYTMDSTVGNAFALPKIWRFENYKEVFSMIKTPDGVGYLEMVWNNVWEAVVPAVVGAIAEVYFAYVMSRFQFRGRNLIYAIIIFSMTIPVVGNSGGYFKLIYDMGLYNTPLFKIVTAIGFGGMGFMVYYGFFKSVSGSYAEAVYIDGGGEFTLFFKVMLPQARPMMMALMINSFIGQWNDYMGPLLYMPSYPTLASGMYLVKNTLIRTGKAPLYFAGILVSMIPVLIIFVIFSDKIMENMSIGGLKG